MTIDYPEGATPLDPDETEGLLLTHITTRGELDRWEQENIRQGYEWAEHLKKTDFFNEEFICRLHKEMFGNVWKWAGEFRQSNKNIGIYWQEIAVEFKKLCDDAKSWIEFETFPPDEFAVHFHHRLVCIHPFPNGNGRHARLMADLILEKIFTRPPFTWGSASLVERTEIRKQYIEALKAADNNDYSLLMAFVRS